MRRRDALKSIGALAGTAAGARLLAGCGDDGEAGITTVVTVMMENRSFDHYLGARALAGLGGDGLAAAMSNPDGDGEPVAVYHDTTPCVLDPPHSWRSSHAQWNQGANDGFVRAYDGAEPHVMGYLTRDELPFLWALADAGAVCDRWFCSVMGPTWPNRAYLHSGQSGGLKSNETEPGGWPWRSIFHQLDDAGVGWAYYYNDLPVVPLFADLDLGSRVRRFFHDFFDDAAAGALPPVVAIDPAFTANDDHPPHHPMLGQQFLASVYAALADSPQWNNCLLVITYDEHGGFFDHVSPPTTADDRADEGFDRLGFRVPTVVAGPYVKPGHVSSVVRDHTSVLAHIGRMFDLAPLTARDAAAGDLSELLDLDRLAAGDPRPPAPMPAIEVDESMIDEACYANRTVAPTDIELLADSGFFDRRLDRRARVPDTLRGIAEALDRAGAGRVRRRR